MLNSTSLTKISSGAANLKKITAALLVAVALLASMAAANVPGGITESGSSVSVKDNGDGTVTMSNGLVSILIVTKTARLNEVKFTHHNGTGAQTSDVLKGKGQYYYGGFNLGTTEYQYSLAVDPARNGGEYADVMLLSDSENKGVMEVHFSMLHGSPGYYSTAIMTHRKQDVAANIIAWGVVTRVPGNFNWISADPLRSFLIGIPTKSGTKVPNSPHEITVNLGGSQEGEYADKFIYGQDHADLRAWGWSSVGPSGINVGAWMMTTMEFSDGGPLKRDVSVYPYSELNNSILTNEVGMGSDGHLVDGEEWKKTCGPWFFYYNECPQSITDPKKAAQLLYEDALKQAEAEKQAWPYTWFKNPRYAQESERGTVTGKFVINDAENPNASPAGLWIGLEEQPQTSNGTHDFQKWLKPYQFWTQTDADGKFTIPHVLPGDRYTLWAYGPGAAGTFLSQDQEGGNPPLECDVSAKPFLVKVLAGQTNDLQTVTWTPKRVGATVFELGYPDRKADKYRHSDDYWAPATAPKLGYPTPVWGGQMEFPLDFADGMNFVVGKSRWALDWNYCLPGDFSKGMFFDTTVADETQYFYEVQSVNASGHSAASTASAGVRPGSAGSAAAPPAPTGLRVTNSGHHKVALSWAPSPDASYYVVLRSPLHADGVGGSYLLRWTVLDDSMTTPAFTDIWPSDGRAYRYCIKAVGPGGISPASGSVDARPVPEHPDAAPPQLTAHWVKTRDGNAITVKWAPAPGATGYVIYRSTNGSPTFQWPANFLSAFVETNYTDKGPQEKDKPRGLPDGDYWYQVTAVNAGGVSPASMIHVTPQSGSRQN